MLSSCYLRGLRGSREETVERRKEKRWRLDTAVNGTSATTTARKPSKRSMIRQSMILCMEICLSRWGAYSTVPAKEEGIMGSVFQPQNAFERVLTARRLVASWMRKWVGALMASERSKSGWKTSVGRLAATSGHRPCEGQEKEG